MKSSGKLLSATYNAETRKRQLCFEVDHVEDEELNRLFKLDKLWIKAVRYTKRRTKDANAYHWVLCSRIAEVLGAGIQEIHKNLMLEYGTINIIDGRGDYRIVPLTYDPKPSEYWIRAGSVHLTEKKTKEEVEHAIYWVVKESHLYNSEEMARLIDGTVLEAKELGIETLPPLEIKRLQDEWESMTSVKRREGQ